MNILFLSTVFPDAAQPSRGAYNLQTCRALAKAHRVRVISPRPWPDVLRARMRGQTISESEATRAAGIEATFPTYWYPPKMMRSRYGNCLWWSVRSTVGRLTETFRPDAVLSYWVHPDGEAAVRAAKQFDVPVGVIAGGSDVLLLPQCPSRGERVRGVLQESDAVLTVSDGLRQSVIDLGIDAGTVHTVYQGADGAVLYPGPKHEARKAVASGRPALLKDRPLLLWVGRMVDVKRLDVLIDGCAALKRSGCEFDLCLIGDGPLRSDVEKQIAARQLGDNVHLIGALPPESLGDWYRAADLTVLTSDSEGLPNVLRESLACGTPFVSTDVGSIREIADEPFGLFVPTDNPKALAEGIATMLDRLSTDAPAPPRQRTWDDYAAEIEDVFRQCGAGRDSSVVCCPSSVVKEGSACITSGNGQRTTDASSKEVPS